MEPQRLRVSIASAQSGSAEGYEALFEEYGPRLYGYFFRAVGNDHDAEDLLGEMMLRLVKQLGKYDDRGRFEPWLFRVAANMVRDRIRRRKSRGPSISLSAEDNSGRSMADQLPGESEPVDAAMLAGEASGHLQRALSVLDDKTRETILLRYFSQMSFKELAEVFQCPIGTVLARVHRGLKALREAMVKT